MELIFDMEEVGTGNNRGDSRKNELIRFYFRCILQRSSQLFFSILHKGDFWQFQDIQLFSSFAHAETAKTLQGLPLLS